MNQTRKPFSEAVDTQKSATLYSIKGGESIRRDFGPGDKDGGYISVKVETVPSDESRWQRIKEFIFWFLFFDAFLD